MKLKTLVENTSVSLEYKAKHGICFYIETDTHKILFDLGQNNLFLENAKKMGVDISRIDTVIISHGHIDHGGALSLFLNMNKNAKVYIRENAFDRHFTKVLGFNINVGIDHSLKDHPQVFLTPKRTLIDEELLLFSDVPEKELYSKSNNSLYAETAGIKHLDNFSHEQSLIISDGQNKILIAGCAHAGIVNIKSRAEKIIDGKLDYVISGFHLYNPVSKKAEANELVRGISNRLDDNNTRYFTCHCTGKKAYSILKETLSDKIAYLSAGTEIEI